MKKVVSILIGCLGFVGLYGAHADDIVDAVRAAVRRDTTDTVMAGRTRSDSPAPATTTRSTTNKSMAASTRSGTNSRESNIVNRSATPTEVAPVNVVARTATTPVARTTGTNTLAPRSSRGTTARTAARTTSTRDIIRATTATATREDILKRSYSKCKNVFTECMDEFCANKDAQLKRCACSARINEFNKIQKQLDEIDDKMLDFNQRLLTVGMDAKDVAVLNTATEGENAFYNTKDISESKKTLDAIAKKLDTNFDTDNVSTNIGRVLSWSLDIDTAFDDIDYIGGVATTAKSGTALYSAALPVCREMAAEVCTDEDLSLAESGYQVLIGQSCDTVEKTYRTAVEQARTKVMESSALLDMSRLDKYQKDNADDTLTCKRKMLTMLTDSTVCGTDLGKCLDVTGQYINPATGEAILSDELANLGTLITRPSGEQSWAKLPGNTTFVKFLNSKKKFLEPAMENCKSISDSVWNDFMEDALAKIKIAQIRKLDDVRQSCTTLVAECLTDANESITNFDARALSTFGVAADQTTTTMCDDILTSCTALLNTYNSVDNQVVYDTEWARGMTNIQTDITYNTIRQTCNQVGRACIIQVCTSTSGNFGLCENIDTSINRKSIINHTACWDEVKECVASAGTDAISAIFNNNGLDGYKLYYNVYGISQPEISNAESVAKTCIGKTGVSNCIYDLCIDECASGDLNQCRVCRLAESIWGNCEAAPTTSLAKTGSHNHILFPTDTDDNLPPLLYWFAQNTNTANEPDSCRDTTCGPGFRAQLDTTTNTVMCVDSKNYTSDDTFCVAPKVSISITDSGITNCCDSGTTDSAGNCCPENGTVTNGICLPSGATLVATFSANDSYYTSGQYSLYCRGSVSDDVNGPHCSGNYFIVKTDSSKRYMNPNNTSSQYVTELFNSDPTTTYKHEFKNGSWEWYNGGDQQFSGTVNNWMVKFGQ